MTNFLIFISSFLFLTLSLSVAGLDKRQSNPVSVVWQACGATRYPDACQSMISSRIKPDSNISDVIQAAFSASAENLITGRGMIKTILKSSSGNLNRSRAAQTCLEGLSFSKFRKDLAITATTGGRLRDARAWTSAALSYQYGCWSGLKYVNNTTMVNSTMSFFDNTLIISTSITLSMLQALDTGSWTPPRTERDGFWEPMSVSGPGLNRTGPGLDFAVLKANATVCKDGSESCYRTVQKAVDEAKEGLKGGEMYVIRIKEGIYEENVRVWFNKSNLVFVGDGIGKTVITADLNAGMEGITTYETATVGILGDGFMASGITFQNTAAPPTHQAVAFRSSSDLSFIENCEFLGNQDTLYVHSLRQFYKSCHIEGNVDFIFGNGAAILENCTILVRPCQVDPEKGEKNSVAAHARSDPAQTTGFVFLGCLINGTDEYMKFYSSKSSVHLNYLARPWKIYSRTVYINCTIGEVISPEGWMPWDGDFALSTLYYGEFGNSGAGADLSKRVLWSSKIPEEHVSTYYFQNFLQGNEWITSTC